jgi:hypothetical protein
MMRRKQRRSRTEELTERTRAEARALSRKRRIEARRAMRAHTRDLDLGTRARGFGYEFRRRLRPVARPVTGTLSAVAPYITRGLLFVVQLIAAVITLIMALGQLVVTRILRLFGVSGAGVTTWVRRRVTPRATVAFVGAAAAILLGASQFANYHGVAVDAPNYAGPIGNVAQAPLTGTETAGSAHLWLLLPVAVVALICAVGASRGDRRFAAGMVVCGILGIAIALAIDLPQGLKTGTAGLAFYGAQAELLSGFWVEIAASAVLILCGCLLPFYSRGLAGSRRGRTRRNRPSHPDVEIPPGLQAES